MLALTLAVSLLSQSGPTLDERAVIAAEKAAEAAQRAADAAQKSAEALAKLAELEAAERASAAPAAPAPAAAAPVKPPSLWSGGASVGLTWLAGNSDSLTFGAAASAQRKSERFIIGLKTFAAYGENTNTLGTPVRTIVAASYGLSGQLDIRLVEKVSIIIGTGFDADYVKNVEARGFWEVGAGVLWVDVKAEDYQKVFLKTDLTFRIGYESRYNYFPGAASPCVGRDANGDPELHPVGAADTGAYPSCADPAAGGGSVLLVAPRAALAFKYALTKTIVFTDDLEIMPNIVGPTAGRVLLNNTAKVSVRVWENFGFGVSWGIKYDSIPAKDRKPFDSALIASLDATF